MLAAAIEDDTTLANLTSDAWLQRMMRLLREDKKPSWLRYLAEMVRTATTGHVRLVMKAVESQPFLDLQPSCFDIRGQLPVAGADADALEYHCQSLHVLAGLQGGGDGWMDGSILCSLRHAKCDGVAARGYGMDRACTRRGRHVCSISVTPRLRDTSLHTLAFIYLAISSYAPDCDIWMCGCRALQWASPRPCDGSHSDGFLEGSSLCAHTCAI